MHSPSALTEHVSPNLAGFFLLDPVKSMRVAGNRWPLIVIMRVKNIYITPIGSILYSSKAIFLEHVPKRIQVSVLLGLLAS